MIYSSAMLKEFVELLLFKHVNCAPCHRCRLLKSEKARASDTGACFVSLKIKSFNFHKSSESLSFSIILIETASNMEFSKQQTLKLLMSKNSLSMTSVFVRAIEPHIDEMKNYRDEERQKQHSNTSTMMNLGRM